jgi:hypothetical protein
MSAIVGLEADAFGKMGNVYTFKDEERRKG